MSRSCIRIVISIVALAAVTAHAGDVTDVGGDGVVDFTDLVTVLAAWGPCL